MPTTDPELLKKPEQKQENKLEEPVQYSEAFSFERVASLIKIRRQKLESIKNFIALKTYNFIGDKIDNEQQKLDSITKKQKQEIAKQNAPQSLPKEFFELHYMKIKSIRID